MRLVLLLFASLFFCSCEKPDDITAIRAVIDDVAVRARAHDVSGMMKHAGASFTADPGNRDEQAVRPLLVLALRRYGKIRIEYPAPGIRLNAERGTASASVPFLIVREGQSFPTTELTEFTNDPVAWAEQVAELVGDPYQLDLRLTRTPDGWKVRSAEISGFKRLGDL